MKRIFPFATFALLFPFITFAAGLQDFFKNLLSFINVTVIPFLLGMAFLFFVWNMVRYFIIGGANENDRETAKSLALYGVIAFVTIFIFWGLVMLLTKSVGLEGKAAPKADYVQRAGQSK